MINKVIIAIIIYSVLIFPIFFSARIYFDKDRKKLYFWFYLFGIIKILYGSIKNYEKGLIVTIFNKKNFFIEYKDFLSVRKSIKPLKDYHIISFNSQIEFGDKNEIMPAFLIFSSISYIDNFIHWFFYQKKPYLNIKNRFILYENESKFIIYLKVKVVFNLLMVILSLIKMLVEKIIYGTKNRKQNKPSS